MIYRYGLGAAGGEACNPLQGINCNPGFQCSPQSKCIKAQGSLYDLYKDPTAYACPEGSSKEYCDRFFDAIIAINPVVGEVLKGAIGVFNWFAVYVFGAYAIFNASNAAAMLFQPVADYWNSLVGYHNIQHDIDGKLDTIWKMALTSLNLPDDIQFSIPRSYLKPDPSILEPNLPSNYWDGYANSPEDALLTYLYAAKGDDGWNKQHKYEYNSGDTNGYAYVKSSDDLGNVLDPLTSYCGPQGELCSHGPFGLTGGGWPEKCNEGCLTQIGQSVRAIFSQRVSALQSSLLIFTLAVARRVAELRVEKDKPIQDELDQVQVLDQVDARTKTNLVLDQGATRTKTDSVDKSGKDQDSGSSFWSIILGLGLITGVGVVIYYVGKEAIKEQKYSKMSTLKEPTNKYLPTLDQFIENANKRGFPSNSYVIEPGFRDLYVRGLYRYVDGEKVENCLDIPNVTAEHLGSGAFSVLVKRLRNDYPNMSIYVENVLNPRFELKLERLGFKRIGDQQPYSYFMKA